MPGAGRLGPARLARAAPYWSILSGGPPVTGGGGWAAVDVEVVLDDEFERLAVEEVGGEDDLGRMRLLARLEAGGDRAVNLAGADAVDERAVAAHQVEDRQVGAGLLGVANGVKLAELGDAADDGGGVVDVNGRAEPAGERGDRLAGDVGNKRGLRKGCGHVCRRLQNGRNQGRIRVVPGSLYYAVFGSSS